MASDLVTYGASLTALELESLLTVLFESNLKTESTTSRRPTPICIWGTHGIGKTQLAAQFARDRGWKVAYCAPAQFEEMGDLHGLPTKMDPDPDVHGDEYTVYLPPDWVPTEEGPGLLLLDDFNRADDRILRGIMQLLQNFELFSWSLPPKWQIVCTANPEGGDYSVTPLDDAMLTRLVHCTMVFDAKSWASWASKNGVDPRGISFILTYPEVVTGQRTTARSLTQFFSFTAQFDDLQAHADTVFQIGMGCLDQVTVSAFMAFVQDELGSIVTAEEVLGALVFDEVKARICEMADPRNGAKRVDRLSALCMRLLLHVSREDYVEGSRDRANLVNFLMLDVIPTDLRFSLHRDLSTRGLGDMIRDRRLASLVLAGLG